MMAAFEAKIGSANMLVGDSIPFECPWCHNPTFGEMCYCEAFSPDIGNLLCPYFEFFAIRDEKGFSLEMKSLRNINNSYFLGARGERSDMRVKFPGSLWRYDAHIQIVGDMLVSRTVLRQAPLTQVKHAPPLIVLHDDLVRIVAVPGDQSASIVRVVPAAAPEESADIPE